MKNVDILIVVDTLGALSSGDLGANVYLIDTNKYVGSGNEGQEELRTACQDGQIIKWRVSPVSPDNNAEISKFTGQIITDNVCNPVKQGIEGDVYWEGRVETRGTSATYQYSVQLTIDGRPMNFDPFLVVKAD
jgi:hypothetical protein